MEKLLVTAIQRFSTHDGPGVRTTVFLKGCPLNCFWCHNPETKDLKNEVLFTPADCIGCMTCASVCPSGAHEFENETHILRRDLCMSCMRCVSVCPSSACEAAAAEMTVDEILREVIKDKVFFGDNGGITLSGGEPLFRKEAVELLKASKDMGLNTTVETCGHVPREILLDALRYTDIFYWDIKDTDSARHRLNTGAGNERIISNLVLADSMGAVTMVRCIMVKGVNMDDKNICGIAETLSSLKNCKAVELMPYHAFGGSKATLLGLEDNGDKSLIPSDEDMALVRDRLAGLLALYGISNISVI